jgi:hypothetical protein
MDHDGDGQADLALMTLPDSGSPAFVEVQGVGVVSTQPAGVVDPMRSLHVAWSRTLHAELARLRATWAAAHP